MAIEATLRFGGIVKRPRAEPRDSTRLPVVIVVEAANPAIVIYWNIEMDFVATRTELCRLLVVHERLEEGAPVRLRIYINCIVMQPSHHRILAGGKLMQLGIKEHEVALAHRALNSSDGVAHQASQTGIRLRRVHDLLDRCIHHPAVKNRGIVTASTPF